MADKDHLRQCIANLLDNAIKYSGDSVKIFIIIQKLNDSLRLTVKDNGIGIETDKINKLFEKYTRLNSEQNSTAGFGIGLSYVKTVIEKHYGKIEVKSVTGIGSEFSLNIPV
jgi:signal transduction histidine kinase